MKKHIALILILSLALSLCSCVNTKIGTESGKQETSADSYVNTDTPKSKKELARITIHDVNPGATREDMEEVFFEDDRYIYSFGYPGSSYIIIEYTDGSKQNVKDALNDGNIAIGDLDAYNIKYYSEPKLIKTIIDHAERDHLATADALEGFYSDETYDYYFGSIKSRYVIVYFKDGTQKPIKDALRDGSVLIKDLDTFGIKYWTEIKPVDNPELSYVVQQSNDYIIPTDLLPMIEAVDLVIVGTYDGTVSTYATEIGQIISIGKVGVFQIIKGEASYEPKEISFYGGALTVSRFMEYARPDISAKRGYDKLTKFEADTKYVGVPVTKYSANPIEGTRYMFLLSYDESTGGYFIACDGYGVREVSDDGVGVWNPDTEKFEPFFVVNEKN